ncbi:helix-turn-helix domain-containing protein [Geosporobacter ferrireducens]
MENSLTLEQLEKQTGISKSALGNYEIEDYKDISHTSILTLAKFYGVSAD